MWSEFVEARYAEHAPYTIDFEDGGDIIVWPHIAGTARGERTPDGVPRMVESVRIGSGDEITPGGYHAGGPKGRRFREGHPGGFDPVLRLADMDTDGVS